MRDGHACIKVEGISYSYESKQVLKNISFSVNKGEFVGITGSNGTGKSTLVKLILGLLPLQKGSITFCQDPGVDAVRLFGYVSQKSTSFNMSFPATVEEVVAANFRPTENWIAVGRKRTREAVRHELERFGIEKLAKRQVGSLSGGEQQKVFVARAMINAPEILFLDEPLSGMDAASSEVLYGQLRMLNRKDNLTILMISHDIPSLIKEAGRIVHLDCNGHIHCYAAKDMQNQTLHELYGI